MSSIFHGSTNGVLGAPMASGPGFSYQDGTLGAVMAKGGGYAYEDGSLGCSACAGGFRGLRGLGETTVGVPVSMILGAMLGVGLMYYMAEKKSTA